MENILAVLKYDAHNVLQKLRQPVDKKKWSTEPAVVNAFYNPNNNDIGNGNFIIKRKLRFNNFNFENVFFICSFLFRRIYLENNRRHVFLKC